MIPCMIEIEKENANMAANDIEKFAKLTVNNPSTPNILLWCISISIRKWNVYR